MRWSLASSQSAPVSSGIGQNTPEAVARDPQVRERYLGQDFDAHLVERGLPDARG